MPTRSIKKDIEFKGLYNKRHTGKVQISSVSGIFGFNLHCDVYFCVSAAISFHNERGITGRCIIQGSREAEPASPIWCCGAIGA